MAFVDSIVAPGMAPPWLLGQVGTAKLKTIGATLDQLMGSNPNSKLVQAVAARLPNRCDQSLLSYIGNDRMIPQGPNETTSSYRGRLRTSIQLWKLLAGTPWGVMRAAVGCILPQQPRIRHVHTDGALTDASRTSSWDTFEAGADVTQPPWHTSLNTGNSANTSNWRWDFSYDAAPSTNAAWWRFWLIIYATGVPWATAGGTWGSSGKKWGDTSKCWGFANTNAKFTQIAQVVNQWKSEHSWCRWIVVSFDDTLFDPWQPADGTHNPAGNFGRWSKIVSNQYVPSRFASARYMNTSNP